MESGENDDGIFLPLGHFISYFICRKKYCTTVEKKSHRFRLHSNVLSIFLTIKRNKSFVIVQNTQ